MKDYLKKLSITFLFIFMFLLMFGFLLKDRQDVEVVIGEIVVEGDVYSPELIIDYYVVDGSFNIDLTNWNYDYDYFIFIIHGQMYQIDSGINYGYIFDDYTNYYVSYNGFVLSGGFYIGLYDYIYIYGGVY